MYLHTIDGRVILSTSRISKEKDDRHSKKKKNYQLVIKLHSNDMLYKVG